MMLPSMKRRCGNSYQGGLCDFDLGYSMSLGVLTSLYHPAGF